MTLGYSHSDKDDMGMYGNVYEEIKRVNDVYIMRIVTRPIVGKLRINNFEIKNKILANFARFIYGMISNRNTYVYNINGTKIWIKTSTDPIYGPLQIRLCRDTTEIPFNAYNCDTIGDINISYSNINVYNDRTEMVLEAVTGTQCNSVALYEAFCGTDGYKYHAILTHSAKTIPANSVIRYTISIYLPYLANFSKMIFSTLLNSNDYDAKDITGTTFSIRGRGDPTASGVFVAVGTGTSPVTIDDYTMENITMLTTYIQMEDTSDSVIIDIYGYFVPSNSMVINEVGLVQRLYDVDGGVHETLLMRHVLSSSLSVSPGRVYLINIRLVF